MRKFLSGAAAAIAVAGVAVTFTGTAKAECFWTGYGWSCTPYASYYEPYPYYPYYGNTYPTINAPDGPSGYKPQWWPSIPGPRPSSGAGH